LLQIVSIALGIEEDEEEEEGEALAETPLALFVLPPPLFVVLRTFEEA
jgi:hypothetical protein